MLQIPKTITLGSCLESAFVDFNRYGLIVYCHTAGADFFSLQIISDVLAQQFGICSGFGFHFTTFGLRFRFSVTQFFFTLL